MTTLAPGVVAGVVRHGFPLDLAAAAWLSAIPLTLIPPPAPRGLPAGPRRRRTSAGLLRAPPGDSGPGRAAADPDQPEQRVFLERAVRQPGGAQRGMELLRLVGPRARPANQSVRRDAD